MPRFALVALLGFALWAVWCFVVLTALVPMIRMHITFWDGAMAWVLSVLPVVIAGLIIAVRSNPEHRT